MTLAELRTSARSKVSDDLTSVGWPDAKLDIQLNIWYRRIVGWVIESMGTIEKFGDDISWTLTSGNSLYEFPSGVLALNRLEIKYGASDDYVLVHRIDDKQTSSGIQNEVIAGASKANPLYRLYGNNIQIYPQPTATVSLGLIGELIMDVTSLSDSGDIPNLNPLIHDAIATGASILKARAMGFHRLADNLERDLMGVNSREDDERSLRYQIKTLSTCFDRGVRQRFIARRRSYK